MERKIVVMGWDGHSNPIYRYYDDRNGYSCEIPSVTEILEQFPDAKYTTPSFEVIPLASLLVKI